MIGRYGPAPDQFGALRLPDGDGPFPVVVLLHGGFWRERYGLELMDPLADDLVARGVAAWNLEYRRVGERSGGGWPATFEDVGAGIDHLAALVERGAPLDLARLATVGHSAGGHLALWAAARPGLPAGAPGASPLLRVTHAVSQGGVPDLAEASRLRLSRDAAAELVAGDRSRFALASPAKRLPLRVPQLLVHGEADEDVPLSLVSRYAEAAKAAGDDVQLVVYEGGHFEHLDPTSEAWLAVVAWLDRFF